MKRSKRSKQKTYVDLEVYPDTSDEEETRPRKTFHHHTTAIVSNAGTRTATSAVAGPPSPKKARIPTSLTNNIDDQGTDLDAEQFEFLQDGFFDTWDAEHEVTRRRVRTGAVSSMLHSISCKLIYAALRTTL